MLTMPDTAPRGLTTDIVRAAFAEHGRLVTVCRVLGCTKQAIHNPKRPELRRAADEGQAAWEARQPPTVVERVRVPKALAARLTKRARKAGLDRHAYCGRILAALETLPEPIPGGGDYGDPMIPILLTVADRDRLRALAGEDFAGRVRAALAKA